MFQNEEKPPANGEENEKIGAKKFSAVPTSKSAKEFSFSPDSSSPPEKKLNFLPSDGTPSPPCVSPPNGEQGGYAQAQAGQNSGQGGSSGDPGLPTTSSQGSPHNAQDLMEFYRKTGARPKVKSGGFGNYPDWNSFSSSTYASIRSPSKNSGYDSSNDSVKYKGANKGDASAWDETVGEGEEVNRREKGNVEDWDDEEGCPLAVHGAPESILGLVLGDDSDPLGGSFSRGEWRGFGQGLPTTEKKKTGREEEDEDLQKALLMSLMELKGPRNETDAENKDYQAGSSSAIEAADFPRDNNPGANDQFMIHNRHNMGSDRNRAVSPIPVGDSVVCDMPSGGGNATAADKEDDTGSGTFGDSQSKVTNFQDQELMVACQFCGKMLVFSFLDTHEMSCDIRPPINPVISTWKNPSNLEESIDELSRIANASSNSSSKGSFSVSSLIEKREQREVAKLTEFEVKYADVLNDWRGDPNPTPISAWSGQSTVNNIQRPAAPANTPENDARSAEATGGNPSEAVGGEWDVQCEICGEIISAVILFAHEEECMNRLS